MTSSSGNKYYFWDAYVWFINKASQVSINYTARPYFKDVHFPPKNRKKKNIYTC